MTSTPVRPNGSGAQPRVLCVLLCGVLTACATRPEPRIDPSRASAAVVRGYLEAPSRLERFCDFSPELSQVVNCDRAQVSVATFVVEEAFVGAPVRERTPVRFVYQVYWPELKLGNHYQYLAVLASDGSRNELRSVRPVAQTSEGEWAIRVSQNEYSEPFPCSSYSVEPESLQFREPPPIYREGWNEASPDKGVRLVHLAAAYQGKSAAEINEQCR